MFCFLLFVMVKTSCLSVRSFRLTDTDVDLLDYYVSQYSFDDRSHVLRTALLVFHDLMLMKSQYALFNVNCLDEVMDLSKEDAVSVD